MNRFHLSRRRFLQATAAGLAGPMILSSSLRAGARNAANDRVQLGFIGVGTMGRGHLRKILGQADVQVVARHLRLAVLDFQQAAAFRRDHEHGIRNLPTNIPPALQKEICALLLIHSSDVEHDGTIQPEARPLRRACGLVRMELREIDAVIEDRHVRLI